MDAKIYEDFFVLFLGNCFCLCAFAWSEGTGGREGRREGAGWIFPRETLLPSHFVDGCGAIPPRFSSGKRTLPRFS